MTTQPPIDPESEDATNAELVPTVSAKPLEPKPLNTPQQARNDAVADLIKAAMSKAGTLELTPEESKALGAEFSDDDFEPGAAGKENLIYICHPALRQRFNDVLGIGQWAIVVRESWNENFRTTKGAQGVKVYVRAMLIVRGCYVAEAVGDMDYFTVNASQNYGDAYEGAKTAAFRRCAKEFGVGLQAWRKDWCAGWWERKNAKGRKPKATPEESRIKFIELLKAEGIPAKQYALTKGWIKAGEELDKIPQSVVPATRAEFDEIMEKIRSQEAEP